MAGVVGVWPKNNGSIFDQERAPMWAVAPLGALGIALCVNGSIRALTQTPPLPPPIHRDAAPPASKVTPPQTPLGPVAATNLPAPPNPAPPDRTPPKPPGALPRAPVVLADAWPGSRPPPAVKTAVAPDIRHSDPSPIAKAPPPAPPSNGSPAGAEPAREPPPMTLRDYAKAHAPPAAGGPYPPAPGQADGSADPPRAGLAASAPHSVLCRGRSPTAPTGIIPNGHGGYFIMGCTPAGAHVVLGQRAGPSGGEGAVGVRTVIVRPLPARHYPIVVERHYPPGYGPSEHPF